MTNCSYTNGGNTVFAPSYVIPTQLPEVLFLSYQSPVCMHMHTYLLGFKSFYEATLSDSLFFTKGRI